MIEPKAKPTVAILLDHMRLGGAERVLIRIANGIVQKGIAVDLLMRDTGNDFAAHGLDEHVRVKMLRSQSVLAARCYLLRRLPQLAASHPALFLRPKSLPKSIQTLASVVSYLEESKPTAVLSTLPQNNIASLLARRIADTPSRVVIRESNLFSRSLKESSRPARAVPLRMAFGWYPQSSAIVAVSQGVADDLIRTLQVDPARVHPIPNSVDPDTIEKLAQQPTSHPWLNDKSVPVIVNVGRLTPQKDHLTLLRAFALLRKSTKARLLVVGEGGMRSVLEDSAKQLRVAEDVDWVGAKPNPFAYIARSDVFVLSSAWEGSPNVILEALVCRTPVVSTDAEGGGPAELLQNGRFGRLVPAGNSAKLSSAIKETLARRPPTEEGYRHARKFSIDIAASRYLDVLLNTQRVGPA